MSKTSTITCRTCDDNKLTKGDYFELTTHLSNYPKKLLSELLCELTGIDTKHDQAETMPQHICDACKTKLEYSYDFVVQARKTNERLLLSLATRFDVKSDIICESDCLEEEPMTVGPEQIWETPHYEILDHTILNLSTKHKKVITKKEVSDPLEVEMCSRINEKASLPKSEDNCSSVIHTKRKCKPMIKTLKEDKFFKCNQCNRSFHWPQSLKRHLLQHTNKNERHSCPCCSRSFCRKSVLRTHLQKHSKQPKINGTNKRSNKQVTSVAHYLCRPHGGKIIQCMICQQKYNKISELRKHLIDHPKIGSLAKQTQEMFSEIISSYADTKEVSNDKLAARIHNDLIAGKYDNFYSITNASGYELSLSSSDTESDFEYDKSEVRISTTKRNYTCELCNVKFIRKFQLFDHQRTQHEWNEAEHVCKRCEARFVSPQLLNHHYKSQCRNAQKRFICRKCPLRFRWKHNLRTHYLEHRNIIEKFECIECKRTYDDKKSFTIHMLTVHTDESKILSCHWCNYKFYRRDYLVKHLKRHGLQEKDLSLGATLNAATTNANGRKQIHCKICKLNFERISELREHILRELKKSNLHKEYKSLSNYSITNESGFELHIDDSESDSENIESKKFRYVCDLCKLQCSRKLQMFQHQKFMHRFEQLPYSCDKCIFKSVSMNILEHHKRTQCQNSQKTFVCEYCNYKFMWPENLALHLNLQHAGDINAKPNTNETTISNMPTTLQCPHCDRIYVQQSRLNNHIRDVHDEGNFKMKTANQKYLCSLCGKGTRCNAELVTHMQRHAGEKPCKCDLCGKSFLRYPDMQKHRRIHTGEKPFHCTVCEKDFIRSDKLKRHMLTHSLLK